MNENARMTPLTAREALQTFLTEMQQQRVERFAFIVGRPLAASLSDAQLRELLDLLLPLAQHRSVQLKRARCGDWHVTLHLRYRVGVRIADAYRSGNTSDLSPEESTALARALAMVETARQDTPDERTLAHRLFDAIRSCASYENPAVGSPAYGHVVSVVSALLEGHANCQGFSDAYYLTGTLAGLTVAYRIGTKGRMLHLWNALWLEGRWQIVDVTSGAFLPDEAARATLGLLQECGQ